MMAHMTIPAVIAAAPNAWTLVLAPLRYITMPPAINAAPSMPNIALMTNSQFKRHSQIRISHLNYYGDAKHLLAACQSLKAAFAATGCQAQGCGLAKCGLG